MKYDERACKFNMDTGCVELLLRDGRKISIDCTGLRTRWMSPWHSRRNWTTLSTMTRWDMRI